MLRDSNVGMTNIINIYMTILLIYNNKFEWNSYRNVWISGHSAGAHLASSILYDISWLDKMMKNEYLNLLKGIVLIGGVYNLNPLLDTNIVTPLKLSK
mgnify:CR=1 FL=1